MSPSPSLQTPDYQPPSALGICGFSGSGKTTLIEAVLPELRNRGLTVAVVKHDVHKLVVDRPGKDSDRLFNAGADVFLHGDQHFCRLHGERHIPLEGELPRLARYYDLILVEGFKHTTIPKIWLEAEEGDPPPATVTGVLDCYPRDSRRLRRLLAFLDRWLPDRHRQTPVRGCILIGGRSRRMGRPKHLLRLPDGRTWLEHLTAQLAPHVAGLVLCGSGDIPAALDHIPRLPDPPQLTGPLAGMLAAMRWDPGASWLVCACDLPYCEANALSWLLEMRRPGIWGIVPKTDRPQPLLAWYDFRAAPILEDLGRADGPRITPVARHPRIICPQAPTALAACWHNCNSPADIQAIDIRPT